jgi:hypothetical protein
MSPSNQLAVNPATAARVLADDHSAQSARMWVSLTLDLPRFSLSGRHFVSSVDTEVVVVLD